MRKLAAAQRGRWGQVLVGVVMLMLVLLIIVPAMVQWVQVESRAAVKSSKTTAAFNLADAGVERGMWKLKSSTSTFAAATAGTVIAGYNFDVTYTDIPGGTYRIKFSSGVTNGVATVTVWGEGRDSLQKEIRSIKAVYQNLSIPGAIIAASNLQDLSGSSVHWGPIMALGRITSYAAANYPRKLSKQDVLPWDVNGLTPPNTDNQMWWSDYDVPELPIFDFVALAASATATNTLNCNGVTNGSANIPCNSSCVNCVVQNMYMDPRYNSNYVWYWDQGRNVIINSPGVNGTFIIRGNLLTNGGDYYGSYGAVTSVNMHVPANAWMEYQKGVPTGGADTTAANQYPADNGLKNNRGNYVLGSCSTSCEGQASGSDLGYMGFLYVGGNLTIAGDADVYGSIWVVGVSTFGSGASANNDIFYNDQLQLPTLNVVLSRLSWQEVSPSTTAWP